jgi:hypothetical protein
MMMAVMAFVLTPLYALFTWGLMGSFDLIASF